MNSTTVTHSADLRPPVNIMSWPSVNDQAHALTPKQEREAYFRSRLYTGHYGHNPLLVAAQPLFSLCTRIQTASEAGHEPQKIAYLMQHELNAFYTHVLNLDYAGDVMDLTRYVLASFIDDILLHLPQACAYDWQNHRLLETAPTQEDAFFTILERLLAAPTQHLDVLELMYVCLKSGYQGKFRQTDGHSPALDTLTDRLYVTLTQHSSQTNVDSLVDLPVNSPAAKTALPHPAILYSLVFIILFIVFCALNYMLNFIAEPLAQQLGTMQHYVKQTLHWLY
jgi:type IV/VI secretion system ImpK/VasF family protein